MNIRDMSLTALDQKILVDLLIQTTSAYPRLQARVER
jgi:hypothetical protein